MVKFLWVGVVVVERVQLRQRDDGLWAIKRWPIPTFPDGFQAHAGTRVEEETKKQEESLHAGTIRGLCPCYLNPYGALAQKKPCVCLCVYVCVSVCVSVCACT